MRSSTFRRFYFLALATLFTNHAYSQCPEPQIRLLLDHYISSSFFMPDTLILKYENPIAYDSLKIEYGYPEVTSEIDLNSMTGIHQSKIIFDINNYVMHFRFLAYCEGSVATSQWYAIMPNPLYSDLNYQFLGQLYYPDFSYGNSYSSNDTISFNLNYPSLTASNLTILISAFVSNLHEFDLVLRNPSGTEVTIGVSENYGAFNSGIHAFSVLLNDSYQYEFGVDNYPGNYETHQLESYCGYFRPHEQLSAFYNESLNGEWKLYFRNPDQNSEVTPQFEGLVIKILPAIVEEPCSQLYEVTVFQDQNLNSLLDVNEPFVPFAKFTSDTDTLWTSSQGKLIFCDLSDTLSLSYSGNYGNLSSTGSPQLNIYPEEANFYTQINYPLTINDAPVDLTLLYHFTNWAAPLISGFPSHHTITVNNIGGSCAYNATLNFEIEGSDISIDSVSIGYIDNLNVTATFDSICPYSPIDVNIYIDVDSTAAMGAEYIITSSIESGNFEENMANNYFYFNSIVLSSYDPNDKAVSDTLIPEAEVGLLEKLDYRIRFQNTGNFYAQRVVIVDTLPEILDAESLEIIGYSHPMAFEKHGKIVKFIFDDIQLPWEDLDSAASNGYVDFRLYLEHPLEVSDSIRNKAEIYFDFNLPIITNYAVTSIDVEEVISTPEQQEVYKLSVYPNPSSATLVIEGFENLAEPIFLSDLSGRIVHTAFANGNRRVELNLGHLEAGVYLVGSESLGWKRVILQK